MPPNDNRWRSDTKLLTTSEQKHRAWWLGYREVPRGHNQSQQARYLRITNFQIWMLRYIACKRFPPLGPRTSKRKNDRAKQSRRKQKSKFRFTPSKLCTLCTQELWIQCAGSSGDSHHSPKPDKRKSIENIHSAERGLTWLSHGFIIKISAETSRSGRRKNLYKQS